VKKVKLSQWHGGNVKPVHVGVYETKFKQIYNSYSSGYSLWNGRFWSNQYELNDIYQLDGFGVQNKQWRGIIK
jgi:hypothetical protein